MNKRIFAIGDIHGCFGSFRELLEHKIELKKNDKLVLLGDYIDRGIQSKAVIDYIIELQNQGFDIIPLMGNHESMLLDAFKGGQFLLLWMYNGGYATLISFEINTINELDQVYIDFFKSLPLYYSFKDYLFVHAGFDDEADDPFEDKFHLTWESRTEYTNPALLGKTIIHGHRPVTLAACKEIIQINSPVINLDTGCVYSNMKGFGNLTALELNTMQLYFV